MINPNAVNKHLKIKKNLKKRCSRVLQVFYLHLQKISMKRLSSMRKSKKMI